MAKFKIEYTYYIGDVVRFFANGAIHQGIIQSVSEIPDIFVECTDDGTYKIYRVGINSLELVYSEHNDSGTSSSICIDKDENIEFVHGGDFYTPKYSKIIYIK